MFTVFGVVFLSICIVLLARIASLFYFIKALSRHYALGDDFYMYIFLNFSDSARAEQVLLPQL
ncbi:MAG: hypothetical protein JSC189_001001 [Candidatus Tokpelaia sp. JSC189]|nr:MAG: hypothetical protein JSC189_001001 [Candidatus Tokpelaia sp. JSC189]